MLISHRLAFYVVVIQPDNVLTVEVGRNNIIPKAQRNKAQRSFQPVKAQRKTHNLIFSIFEEQTSFRNKLFDSVEAQRNSAIAEPQFRTKLKRNHTSAIEISQHKANTTFFAILDRKKVNNFQTKAEFINITVETKQN